MTYEVLVENEREQTYTATLLGGPSLRASGTTQEEALGKLRETLKTLLRNAKIVQIQVDLPCEPNPWVRLAGVYKDHPLFDELLAEMEKDRRELDGEEPDFEKAS